MGTNDVRTFAVTTPDAPSAVWTGHPDMLFDMVRMEGGMIDW